MVKPINRPSVQTIKPQSGAQATPAQTQDRNASANASQSANAQEQVALSGKAKMAQDLKKAAHQSSGVDAARIQVIRHAIASGSYQVSPTAIAKAVAEAAWISQGNK